MRSTHLGTCQICGAVQAVNPKSHRLAKHGYTTRWGIFSGNCNGSGELPLELCAGLIPRAIELAQRDARELDAESFRLRHNDTGGLAWRRTGQTGAEAWQQGRVVTGQEPHQDGRPFEVYYFVPTAAGAVDVERLNYYGADRTVAAVSKQLNEHRATFQDKRSTELRLYAQWQHERVANWHERPLIERREAATA